MNTKIKKVEQLKNLIPILTFSNFKNELSIVILNSDLVFCLEFLKNHIGFQYKILSYIAGVDFLLKKYRFAVIYDLLSLTFNNRIRVNIFITDLTIVTSSVNVFGFNPSGKDLVQTEKTM